MSFRKRFFIYCQENVVLLTGVPLIVAIHWGWNRLQHTSLVPEEQRKELPVIRAAKFVQRTIVDEFNNLLGKKETPPVEPSTQK